MPQLDTFIFLNSQIYFIILFILFLYFNTIHFLPYLATILKLRIKIRRITIRVKLHKIPLPLILLQKSSSLTNIRQCQYS